MLGCLFTYLNCRQNTAILAKVKFDYSSIDLQLSSVEIGNWIRMRTLRSITQLVTNYQPFI